MKHLILIFLLASCGHEMPGQQELTDRDGDQIKDEFETSEFAKYTADVLLIGKINARLLFQQGKESVENVEINLENSHDLLSYSKDLLVKNKKALPIDDYFTEDTGLKIVSSNHPSKILQDKVVLKLILENFNERIILKVFDNGKYIEIGSIQKVLEFVMPKELIERIISGKAFFTISRSEKRKFYTVTQEENIKEKTYRIFYNDGVKTHTYYVSNEFDFSRVLRHLKINEYRIIDEVSLLTTDYETDRAQWWVRDLNQKDKVIVKESLKNLSDHYFKNFEKNTINIKRVNGVVNHSLKMEKSTNANSLIKIRTSKSMNFFSYRKVKEQYHTGGGAAEMDRCSSVNRYRSLLETSSVPYSIEDFKKDVRITGDDYHFSNFDLKTGTDEQGEFWELRLPEGITKFEIELRNLSETEYLHLGLYESKCLTFQNGPRLGKILLTPEAQLSFDIETYIEKI